MKTKNKVILIGAVALGSIGFFSYKALSNKNEDSKIVVIKMTVDQAQYVLNALADKPYKEAADLIESISYQAKSQLNPLKVDSSNIKKDSTHNQKKK